MQESVLTVGVITTPRNDTTVSLTLSELRRGGFDELVHVFCEPGTISDAPIASVEFHLNAERLGALGNWAHCLHWLYGNTKTDYLMICEDDVAYCRGAKQALLDGLKTFNRFGFLSLYTPKRDAPHSGPSGNWFQANHGRKAWGTQAMCLSRESALLLLEFPRLHNENQISGPTDSILSECFLLKGIPCYYHRPSLADHLGRKSTIGHEWYESHTGLDFDPTYTP